MLCRKADGYQEHVQKNIFVIYVVGAQSIGNRYSRSVHLCYWNVSLKSPPCQFQEQNNEQSEDKIIVTFQQ